MNMVGFSVNAESSPSLLTEETFAKLGTGELRFSELNAEFYTSEKGYKDSRATEMFKMIEAGCTPCEEAYYYGIKSLIK